MAGIIRNLTPILGLVVVGSLVAGVALSILGVVLVYIGATGNTELSFFGQTFKSANVGIGALFLGAALIVLVVRRALKSVDRAVHAESQSQQPHGGEGTRPKQEESAAGSRNGATVVASEELKRLVNRLSSDIVPDRGSLLDLLDTHRAELIKGVSNWPGRASSSPFLFDTVCPRLAVYGLAFVQDIPMSVHRMFSLSREGLAVLNYIDELGKTERGDEGAKPARHLSLGATHWTDPLKYIDHTGQRLIRVFEIDVHNSHREQPALNAIARLKRIVSSTGPIHDDIDRSRLKAVGKQSYSQTIWPRDHEAWDLFSVSMDTAPVIFLNSELDVKPRRPTIKVAGNYVLTYEVLAEHFPVLEFDVRLSVNDDPEASSAALVESDARILAARNGGSVYVNGNLRAGDGSLRAGGDVLVEGGAGGPVGSGGDVKMGPGGFRAGDGGPGGKGGGLTIRGGPGGPRDTETLGARELWQEKLDFLLKERACISDPEMKFGLDKKIEEAQDMLNTMATTRKNPKF